MSRRLAQALLKLYEEVGMFVVYIGHQSRLLSIEVVVNLETLFGGMSFGLRRGAELEELG